jgi:hypothetical protein
MRRISSRPSLARVEKQEAVRWDSCKCFCFLGFPMRKRSLKSHTHTSTGLSLFLPLSQAICVSRTSRRPFVIS